ncbi:hypothetical protein [Micromonospora zhanjiangensis]|uniref:Secreted protein n=1 Tax=Micromonospora zhanjiangensis TaxID=1522057 RepID=A0ABV8KUW4_9ACTN
MKRFRTLLSTLAVAAMSLTGLAVAGAPASAATSCYGGAINLNYKLQSGYREYGPYTTSSRCNDINMRLTTDDGRSFLAACVVFVAHTTKCNNNDSYQIFGPPWGTVATDVKDGTKFVLRVRPYDSDAKNVNFQLAY